MGDMYGDQISPDMSLRMNETSYGSTRGSVGVGFYEDNFRMEQYGRPARLECSAPDPYIQDDIRKSQRLAPIRIGSVPGRENQFLAKQYADTVEVPSHSLQRTFRVPVAGGDRSPAFCGECSGCGSYVPAPGTGAPCGMGAGSRMCGNCSNNSAKSGSISAMFGGSDGVPVFLIFIFIVLVFLCVYYWKSISDIKESLNMIREALKMPRQG